MAAFGTVSNQLKSTPLNHGTQAMQVGIADEKAELGGRMDVEVFDRDFVRKVAIDELQAILSTDLDTDKTDSIS
jgi:hypothetical protein